MFYGTSEDPYVTERPLVMRPRYVEMSVWSSIGFRGQTSSWLCDRCHYCRLPNVFSSDCVHV